MRHPFVICLSFFIVSAYAQNKTYFSPIHETIAHGFIDRPNTVFGGESVEINGFIVTPSKVKVKLLPVIWRDWHWSPTNVVLHSPDFRYRIEIWYGIIKAKRGAANNKSHLDDFYAKGISTDSSDWKFESREIYPIAITNKGEIVGSEIKKLKFDFKGDVVTHFPAEVTAMKGMYLYDPKTGTRKTITEEDLCKSSDEKFSLHRSQDGERYTIVRDLGEKTIATTYNIHSGEKWEVGLQHGYIQQMGNTVIILYGFGRGTAANNFVTVVSLKDGKELLRFAAGEEAIGSVYRSNNVCLNGDDFYFLNVKDYSVARLQQQEGKMEMADVVSLDVESLALSGNERYLTVLNDYYGLIPFSDSEAMRRSKYECAAYFFKRKTGGRGVIIEPFFEKPVTEAAKNVEARAKIAVQENKCAALIKSTPFPIGSLVRKKGGNCNVAGDEQLIWSVDCSYSSYITTSIARGKDAYLQGANYELCEVGPYEVCSLCRGSGTTQHYDLIKDDGWKQVAFDNYVRDPNAVKSVKLTQACERCGGKKIVRK